MLQDVISQPKESAYASVAFNMLIAETSEYHARLIKAEIAAGYANAVCATVTTCRAVREALNRREFDVVLIALDLLDAEGRKYVEKVRVAAPKILLLAVGAGAAEEESALAAGADAFLVRDADLSEQVKGAVQCWLKSGAETSTAEHTSRLLSREQQAELIRMTAGTLFHEVNNPLATILGITELIMDNGYKKDPYIARKVRIIRRSAMRIQSVLSRLSKVSQPAVRETVSGRLIDPASSQISATTGVRGTYSTD